MIAGTPLSPDFSGLGALLSPGLVTSAAGASIAPVPASGTDFAHLINAGLPVRSEGGAGLHETTLIDDEAVMTPDRAENEGVSSDISDLMASLSTLASAAVPAVPSPEAPPPETQPPETQPRRELGVVQPPITALADDDTMPPSSPRGVEQGNQTQPPLHPRKMATPTFAAEPAIVTVAAVEPAPPPAVTPSALPPLVEQGVATATPQLAARSKAPPRVGEAISRSTPSAQIKGASSKQAPAGVAPPPISVDVEPIVDRDSGLFEDRQQQQDSNVPTPSPMAGLRGDSGPNPFRMSAGQASGADFVNATPDAFSAAVLDLGADDAWLDQLTRDVSNIARSGGDLRFRLNPQNLGALQVTIERQTNGLSVNMITETLAARDVLSEAQAQVIAEARSQGLTINDVTVTHRSSDQPMQGGAQQNPQRDRAMPTPLRTAGQANASKDEPQDISADRSAADRYA